jgi:hypothetical protein
MLAPDILWISTSGNFGYPLDVHATLNGNAGYFLDIQNVIL